MFIDEKTLNKIHANVRETVIRATHRSYDLIPALMEVIKDTPEYVQMMNVVPAFAAEDHDSGWWDCLDAIQILEELFDILDSYAPDGFYFGAHIGDGSDFGFWENEEEY
jgi:hypothetical protein